MDNFELKDRLKDALVKARMQSRPFLILEGADDAQIYEKLLEKIKLNAKAKWIGDFRGEGCKAVIEAIYHLQESFEEDSENLQYILGIIDQDARPFKPKERTKTVIESAEIDYEMLLDKGLFMLKYYSIESYFCVEKNIFSVLRNVTLVQNEHITPKILTDLQNEWAKLHEGLYYVSLDALKQECFGKENYNAIKGYKDDEYGHIVANINQVGNPSHQIRQALNKKNDLDTFANEKGINLQNLKQIVKGKWLLMSLAYSLWRSLHEDETLRREDERFRSKLAGSNSQIASRIYDELQKEIDLEEFNDIISKINSLFRV